MKKLTVKAARFFLILLVPSIFLMSCEDDHVNPDSLTIPKGEIKVAPGQK